MTVSPATNLALSLNSERSATSVYEINPLFDSRWEALE
jgi:hypothetical protein